MSTIRNLKGFVGLMILAVFLSGCGSHRTASVSDRSGSRKWTIMVYMAADNDLEAYAIQDMNEMERVGSTSQVTVVAQIDRAQGYDSSNGNWTSTRRYYVGRDTSDQVITSRMVEDLGEQDMASPETLSNFLGWATAAYPADHYLLVLWDHGRGWQTRSCTTATAREVRAVAVDDQSGTEMSLNELGEALAEISKIDVILFDACLMAMIEAAYEIKDFADIMVASEDNIPVTGQPYEQMLLAINQNPAMTSYEFSRTIVDTYMDYYTPGRAGTYTFSALNLAGIDGLVAASDGLARIILTKPAVRSAVRSAQTSAQRYDFDKQRYTDYKDLYDFARLLRNSVTDVSVRNAAQLLMAAVSEAVIYERHCGELVTNSHGISVYLPDSGKMLTQYENVSFARDTRWDELLKYY